MPLANQKPGKLDTLSQHAVEANHSRGKLDMLSQHTQHKHSIPAYIAQINLYKKRLQKPRTADKLTQQHAVQLEEPEQKEQQSKQLQHLGRLGKRCEA